MMQQGHLISPAGLNWCDYRLALVTLRPCSFFTSKHLTYRYIVGWANCTAQTSLKFSLK